jgi:hypothetical protein
MRFPTVIRIQQGNKITVCGLDADIARLGDAAVGLLDQTNALVVRVGRQLSLNQLGTLVSRSVIDHNNL